MLCLRTSLWLSVMLSFCCGLRPLHAAIVYNDTFEDGRTDDPGNPTDLAWYTRFSASVGTVTTGVDASLNNNAALLLNKVESGAGNNVQTAAPFANFALSTVGQYLQLNFDFRLSNTNYPAGINNLRFGLYNDQGTPVTVDESTASNDDKGYYFGLGSGSVSAAQQIFREDSGISPILGGTDRTNLGTTSAHIVPDFLKHAASLRVERTATGVDISVYLDNTLLLTRSDALAGAITSFNMLAVGSAFNGTDTDFNIDNVQIDTNVAIPEPTSWALLGCGLLAGWQWRRRRAS